MIRVCCAFVLSSIVVGCAGQPPTADAPPVGGATPAPLSPALRSQAAAGAAETATEPKPSEEASEAATRVPEPRLLASMPPAGCADDASCVPPEEFSKAVCKGRYPGLAVALFEKSTPWQRRYVKVEFIEPVNTYGGSISRERLSFTEEVLLLREQGSGGGGIVVSGASDVDVMRWDGTCVTVREEFLSEHRMPTIKNAEVNWRFLDKSIQEGLLGAKYVSIRYNQQRKACRSSSATNPSPVCANATEKLNDAITVAVRGGIQLPEPGKLPVWKHADSALTADPERTADSVRTADLSASR